MPSHRKQANERICAGRLMGVTHSGATWKAVTQGHQVVMQPDAQQRVDSASSPCVVGLATERGAREGRARGAREQRSSEHCTVVECICGLWPATVPHGTGQKDEEGAEG